MVYWGVMPEMRAQFLAVLQGLEKKQSIVAAQDDLRQVIRVLQFLLMEEAIHMSLHDNVPYQKGLELGTLFARSFKVRDDREAHINLGKFFARQAGYSDMDSGWEFMAGFRDGIKEASPKMIGGAE